MQIISTETRESFLSLKKKRLLKKPTSGELSDAEKAIAAFIKAVNDQNLATVADAERKIDQIETWPVSYASWPQVEQALNSSKDALGAYQAFLIFDDKTRLPEIYKKLASKNKNLLGQIRQSTSGQFANFDVSNSKPFFEVYPIKEGLSDFLAKNPDLLRENIAPSIPSSSLNFQKNMIVG